MARTRKAGNLKLAGTPYQLREKARVYARTAADALAKSRALYNEADRKERQGQEDEETFYLREHIEGCGECSGRLPLWKPGSIGYTLETLRQTVGDHIDVARTRTRK